jgi:acylphosphatase
MNEPKRNLPPHAPGTGVTRAAFFAQIRGRVQGVGFRYTAQHEALRLGLTGWIRNSPEGDVEVWAEGPKEKLGSFLQWLYRGPPGARVDLVRHETRTPRGTYRRFSIEY